MKRIEPLSLAPSLEKAFQELDSLDAMHPDARGTTYAGTRTAGTRDCLAST